MKGVRYSSGIRKTRGVTLRTWDLNVISFPRFTTTWKVEHTDLRAAPERQTTADFLTSMTSPQERRVRPGWGAKVPCTSAEFAARWQASPEREALMAKLLAYQDQHPWDERWKEFAASHKAERSTAQRINSPYTIPFPRQVQLCLWRSWKRLLADPAFTLAQLTFNLIMGFVLGSTFYNLAADTSSLYYRGGLIFFAMLFNAFASELEVS